MVIIPLGTLAGWLIGKVQTFKKRDEIADLYEQQLPDTNFFLMGQTFNKFKNDYQQYGPKPSNEISSDLNQTDPKLDENKYPAQSVEDMSEITDTNNKN